MFTALVAGLGFLTFKYIVILTMSIILVLSSITELSGVYANAVRNHHG